MTDQITTLTICQYQGLANKIWAFGMMQFAHKHLSNVPGQQFYKLMGSGKGIGFNPWPDWSIYTLLQVWDEEQSANTFLRSSKLLHNYRRHANQIYTIFMKTIKSHGTWSGHNPFHPSLRLDDDNPYLAVITRATIKTNQLRTFWRYVPTSQKPIENAEGLIYTKGIGEVPIKQMATFSLWESENGMKKFAYQSKEHQKAIQLTRKVQWYSEELFARFQPYKTLGSMSDINFNL